MAAPLRIEKRSRSAVAGTATPVPGIPGPLTAAPSPAAPPSARGLPAPPSPSTPFQEYMVRLVKLIPGEVVGLYLVGLGVIPSDTKVVAFGIWAGLCLVLAIWVRARLTSDPANHVPPQWTAVLISAVSYVLWVFTMPGPLQTFGLGLPYVGSLAVLVWTFVVPLFYQG